MMAEHGHTEMSRCPMLFSYFITYIFSRPDFPLLPPTIFYSSDEIFFFAGDKPGQGQIYLVIFLFTLYTLQTLIKIGTWLPTPCIIKLHISQSSSSDEKPAGEENSTRTTNIQDPQLISDKMNP
ncbi:unnamed protein product [Allacma fusca]|uniref:Uncharacterized protein n=1 Tax=Allacma fusca TaxID=39272 RepID=A0A8J2L6G9_9HEXA|nr:unnamed protein product [Allacma fusca]